MDTRSKSPFRRGLLGGAPFILVIVPFGMLFGVVASEAGLPLSQTMGFTVLVIAGASQFTALALLQDQAPTVIVLATALAVNLRMAMYSASLAPYLGKAPLWKRALVAYVLVDQTYALAHPEFEARPKDSLSDRLHFIAGVALAIAPLWYIATWGGAVLGQAIPPEFALDFAVPITFLALIAPTLTTLPHLLAALTSITLALLLAGLPFSLGLILAAIAAMTVGAVSESWLERRT